LSSSESPSKKRARPSQSSAKLVTKARESAPSPYHVQDSKARIRAPQTRTLRTENEKVDRAQVALAFSEFEKPLTIAGALAPTPDEEPARSAPQKWAEAATTGAAGKPAAAEGRWPRGGAPDRSRQRSRDDRWRSWAPRRRRQRRTHPTRAPSALCLVDPVALLHGLDPKFTSGIPLASSRHGRSPASRACAEALASHARAASPHDRCTDFFAMPRSSVASLSLLFVVHRSGDRARASRHRIRSDFRSRRPLNSALRSSDVPRRTSNALRSCRLRRRIRRQFRPRPEHHATVVNTRCLASSTRSHGVVAMGEWGTKVIFQQVTAFT
jgi:hypothetical protein